MATTYEDRLIRGTVADRPDCPFLSRSRSRRAWRLYRSGRLIHNVVAGKDRPCLVSGELHRDLLGDADAHQVSHGRASEVMRDPTWTAGNLARTPPRLPERPNPSAGSPPRSRGNTHGLRTPCVRRASCVARCASIASRSCSNRWPYGNVRPSSFFVWPGSSRTIPAVRSTCRHCNTKTSLGTRQPVRYANVTTDRRAAGRAVRTASDSSRSKNQVRPLCSRSIGICGRWRTLCASAATAHSRRLLKFSGGSVDDYATFSTATASPSC